MRTIKFRGITIDVPHRWIYGSVHISSTEKAFISQMSDVMRYYDVIRWIEVIPETVGQYTGVNDKNGKEIYQHDNLALWLMFYNTRDKYFGNVVYAKSSLVIENIIDEKYRQPKCEYLEHSNMLLSDSEIYEQLSREYKSNYGEVFTYSDDAKYVEVIGTIHDYLLTPHAMNLLTAIANQVYIKCENIEGRDQCVARMGKCEHVYQGNEGIYISIHDANGVYPYGRYTFMHKTIDHYPTITAQSFIKSNT